MVAILNFLWPVGLSLDGAMTASAVFGEADFTQGRGIEACLREWGGLGPFSGN